MVEYRQSFKSVSLTPALIHNNVTSNDKGLVAFSNRQKVCFLNVYDGSTYEGCSGATIHSLRYINTGVMTVLAVCTTNGTQFFSEDGSQMIFFIPLSGRAVEGRLSYHQGVCCAGPHLLVGASEGNLNVVLAQGDSMSFLGQSVGPEPASAVSDICFAPLVAQVVTVHDNGHIFYWVGDVNGTYTPSYGGGCPDDVPSRCLPCGTSLIVSFGSGVIRAWDMLTRDLRVEISGHARWINAMDALPDAGVFASVGEDTVLNVWAIEPETFQVSLLHSSVVADKLITGVAFIAVSQGSTALTCTAYDADLAYIFEPC